MPKPIGNQAYYPVSILTLTQAPPSGGNSFPKYDQPFFRSGCILPCRWSVGRVRGGIGTLGRAFVLRSQGWVLLLHVAVVASCGGAVACIPWPAGLNPFCCGGFAAWRSETEMAEKGLDP
jgi:hypothetical protein